MIEVNNLVKYYGDFKAVDNVSFKIEKGEIVGLLGPNGAGKSSTIRILCGYLSSTEGQVLIDGLDVSESACEVKSKIGYLPESAPLYLDMMVYDYLDYIAHIREIPQDKIAGRIREMSELCGLSNVMHKNISQISKGYRQRVGLAHALIGDPDILVLDEPTTGLDPNQIVEIRKLIKEIGKEKTVILCSHILSEVEATCGRIIIINNGRLVADDVTEHITNKNPSHQKLFIQFKGGEKERIKESLNQLPMVNSAVWDEEESKNNIDAFKLEYGSTEDKRLEIMNHIIGEKFPVISFYQQKQSLETVFRELTLNSDIQLDAAQSHSNKII